MIDFLSELEAAPAVERPAPDPDKVAAIPRRVRRPDGSTVGPCEVCGLATYEDGRPLVLLEMLHTEKLRKVCPVCRAEELRRTTPTCAAPACKNDGGYYYQTGVRHCPRCLVLMPSTCHQHYPLAIPAERLHICPAPTGEEGGTPDVEPIPA